MHVLSVAFVAAAALVPCTWAKAQNVAPKYPYDPSTVADCYWWYDNGGSDVIACQDIPSKTGASMADFRRWNPSITADCGNFQIHHSYCVDGPEAVVSTSSSSSLPASSSPVSSAVASSSTTSVVTKFTTTTTTTSTASTTTTVGNGISTPQPTQPGIVDNCNKFYYIQSGDTCDAIASKNGISVQDLKNWNKGVGDGCTGLWANTYACINIIGNTPSSTRASNGIPTPTPLQPSVIENCESFYYVRQGQSCTDVADANGITAQDLASWNRKISSSCSGLWSNAYACVSPIRKYDFKSGNTAEWTVADGKISVQAETLVVDSNTKAYVDTEMNDFVLAAEITLPSNNGDAGFVVRSSNFHPGADSYKGYYVGFSASDGGKAILGRVDNSWSQLSSKNVGIQTGQKVSVWIEVAGSSISVSVNTRANVVISTSDGAFAAGSIGVRTHETGAIYDNIVIGSTYVDAFRTNMADWTIADGGFDARQGFMTSQKVDSGKAVMNAVFGDFTMDADMFLIDSNGGDAGFIIRANDLTSGADSYRGYYVGLTQSSVVAGKANYGWTSLQTMSTSIANSQWHKIRIGATSGLVIVYVDDMSTPKLTFYDTSFAAGHIGVRVFRGSALYNNFKITKGLFI